MARKKTDEGLQNIRCLAYASLLSAAAKKTHIDADEIFLGTFLYTKEKQFFEVFWKFLGVHEVADIHEYIEAIYNFSENTPKGTFTMQMTLHQDMHDALTARQSGTHYAPSAAHPHNTTSHAQTADTAVPT